MSKCPNEKEKICESRLQTDVLISQNVTDKLQELMYRRYVEMNKICDLTSLQISHSGSNGKMDLTNLCFFEPLLHFSNDIRWTLSGVERVIMENEKKLVQSNLMDTKLRSDQTWVNLAIRKIQKRISKLELLVSLPKPDIVSMNALSHYHKLLTLWIQKLMSINLDIDFIGKHDELIRKSISKLRDTKAEIESGQYHSTSSMIVM